MEIKTSFDVDKALAAFAALAQATRLEAFRLLMRHEPEGLPAGEIARALDQPQNTMSAHLSTLSRAGLVRAQRESRVIRYRADLNCLRALVMFLIHDCCNGRKDICGALFADLADYDVTDSGVGLGGGADVGEHS